MRRARDGTCLVGFKGEAATGTSARSVRTPRRSSSYILVDTVPWIFGKEVLQPVGTVDVKEEKINVNLTKDQIKDSPECDRDKHRGDAAYREQLGRYYGRGPQRASHGCGPSRRILAVCGGGRPGRRWQGAARPSRRGPDDGAGSRG